jgi:hypothetical protein
MAPMTLCQQRILICRIYAAFSSEALMANDLLRLKIQTPERGQHNSGNLVGSLQPQQVVGHTHTFTERRLEAEGGSGFEGGGTSSNSAQGGGFPRSVTTSSSGGSETRPKNAYVHWIIRAR